MNHCLQCGKPCEATAMYCDECWLLVQDPFQQRHSAAYATPLPSSPSGSTFVGSPTVPEHPAEPSDPMGEAATSGGFGSPVSNGGHASPQPWPGAGSEEDDSDIWVNHTNPFSWRHLPHKAALAPFEEEEVQRAWDPGAPPALAPGQGPRARLRSVREYFVNRYPRRVRIALIAIVLFLPVALAIDDILLFKVGHNPHSQSNQEGIPTLTLSQNVARVNDTLRLTMQHFAPMTKVALTHDLQEPIQINAAPFVTVDQSGQAQVSFVIDNSWRAGFHLIVAEDVATRYTVSAQLQITGGGPTQQPSLALEPTHSDLGAAVVGANTIRPVTLVNLGGGSITWSASSDQSWLLVAPDQGIFSQSQTLSIAAQRVGLKPGNYKGEITISSPVSGPQRLEVEMSVTPLPPNAGPFIALLPALLSFTATDGALSPAGQSLTLSNPGSGTLYWSLSGSDPITSTTLLPPLHALGSAGDWLSAVPASGVLPPGASTSIQVSVSSQNLLPGPYLGTLRLSALGGAFDSPQDVNVALSVDPRCGISTSLGSMAFTAVEGRGNPGTQTLGLTSTPGCSGALASWSSTSTASWLAVSPARGQLRGMTSAIVSVSVSAAGLLPGTYSAAITFSAGQSAQSITVQLVVQRAPSPTVVAPVMGASPLSLNFGATQGQRNPAGQVVTIINNGNGELKWNSAVNSTSSGWLGAAPSGGVVAPGQSGQVVVSVNTSSLTAGSYVGQITLNGSDANGVKAAGSPQTITINLVVQPPCAISPPSSSSFSFSAIAGTAPQFTPQAVSFTWTGNCSWPVTLRASGSAGWLKLTPASGTVQTAGGSGSIGVSASIAGLKAGTYTAKVTIAASDASGTAAQGSPQTLSVSLVILPPCVLSPSPARLSFSVLQGQAAQPQQVTFSEKGTCKPPVGWTATTNKASSTWLVLSPTSGTDNGSGGTLSVNVNSTSLAPGSYSGHITFDGHDSAGTTVADSAIAVSLRVTPPTFSVSGTVLTCLGTAPTCTTPPVPVPGATLILKRGSTTVATTTAGAAGNYSFTGVVAGTYTLFATDASSNPGSVTLSVTGNITSNITVFT